MKDFLLRLYKNAKNVSFRANLICFVAVCIVAIIASLVFSGLTVATSVIYDGEAIGVISDASVYAEANTIALSKISGEGAKNSLYKPELKKRLTLKSYIKTAEALSDAIISNTDVIIPALALTVNGQPVFYTNERKSVEDALAVRLSAYNLEKADENVAEFVDSVKLEEVLCTTADFADSQTINGKINELSVRTTVKYNEDVVVNYKTVTKYDSSQLFTYRVTQTQGVNGLNHNVDMVVYINGVETERTHLEQQVIKAPVNKVVVVGTKYPQDTTASLSGMICPLPRGSYAITSKYGEKRGGSYHYALDLGTYGGISQPIYAVKGGVVKTATYNKSFGYYVIIDHGGGVETLYAHARTLTVKVGQVVTQGQTIAYVGSTGNSTGPHLHIEVRVNGAKKNPNNYINF